MAQAHHSNLKRGCSSIHPPVLSSTHSGSSDSATFDPPRAFSPSLAPSYLRARRLGRSRSASFSPSSLSLFPIFPNYLQLIRLLSPFSFFFFRWKFFRLSGARTSGARRLPRFCTRLSTRRLFRGYVSATSSPSSRSSRRDPLYCPYPLYFYLAIILVLQILLASLALSGKTSAPARPVKFHYEINPDEYSYSERSSRFYYYLS